MSTYVYVNISGFPLFTNTAQLTVGGQKSYDFAQPELDKLAGHLVDRYVDSVKDNTSTHGSANITLADVLTALGQTAIPGNSGAVDIEFTTAIPFTANAFMPQQLVSSVLTFTVDTTNAKKGYRTYVRLVADGSHAPTFTGFKEWGGSAAYDNRAGLVNQVEFFYDGYDYWFFVNQAVNAVALPAQDTTAPTVQSAAVADSAPSIVTITLSETLDANYVPISGAFTVAGHTVLSVAVSGSTLAITLQDSFVTGEAARTVAYTQPGATNARDLAGNLLGNFTGFAIANNVGAPIRLMALSAGLTESGSGQYTYNESGADTFGPTNHIGGIVEQALQAGVDGSLSMQFTGYAPNTGTEPAMSLQAGTTLLSYTGVSCFFYASRVDNKYIAQSAGAVLVATNTVVPADGDIMRLRRTGTNIAAEVSKNSGSTWITIYTWSNQNTGILYYQLMMSTGAGTIHALTGVGLAVPVVQVVSGSLRLTALSSDLVESGSGPYTYTESGSSAFNNPIGGVANQALQSGVDGSLSFKFTGFFTGGGGSAPAVGVMPGSTPTTYNGGSMPYFVFADVYTTGAYTPFTNGTSNTPTNVVIAADGDVLRMRRTGSSLISEVSKDAGSTWTTIFTWTGVSTNVLHFQVMEAGAPGTIYALTGVGLA